MKKVVIGDCELYLGDCLERMKEIPDGSVDMVLTDPPFGTIKGMKLKGWDNSTTKWDDAIDNNKMWHEINRVLRVNGCCILFAQDPYTSVLMNDCHNNVPFSYRAAWVKDNFANALLCNKAMVSYFEDVCVFFKRYDSLALHPLRHYFSDVLEFIGKNLKQVNTELGHRRAEHCFYIDSTQFGLCTEAVYNELIERYNISKMQGFRGYAGLKIEDDAHKKTVARVFNLHDGKKYKSNILEYKKDYNGYHPTQKPVLLLEDLIKTYSNEGDTVLDFTAGSMSTAIACINTNRKGIMIEKDEGYFKIAQERIDDASKVKPQNGKLEL